MFEVVTFLQPSWGLTTSLRCQPWFFPPSPHRSAKPSARGPALFPLNLSRWWQSHPPPCPRPLCVEPHVIRLSGFRSFMSKLPSFQDSQTCPVTFGPAPYPGRSVLVPSFGPRRPSPGVRRQVVPDDHHRQVLSLVGSYPSRFYHSCRLCSSSSVSLGL